MHVVVANGNGYAWKHFARGKSWQKIIEQTYQNNVKQQVFSLLNI